MEFIVPLLSSYIIFCTRILATAESPDTFSVVTSFQGLTRLYLRMKIREPHLEPYTTLEDVRTKKRVCESVAESVYFDELYDEDSVDMDAVRKDLTTRMENEMKDLRPSRLLDEVLQDYEAEGFTYRTRLTPFSTVGGDRKEFAFACATKDHNAGRHVNVYYVSDSYNIRSASDVPAEGETRARFVCVIIASRCELVALAEEPAVAFPGSNYRALTALEDIYRHMRRFYQMAENVSDDPLCGLRRSEKLRVCASVLNASNVLDKGKLFNPNPYNFRGKCVQREVIFLILGDDGERTREEDDGPYYEWMLSCPVESIIDETIELAPYLLSRAYHSHHVFVHSQISWTGEWYIESVCENVAVVIESGIDRVEGEEEETPPSTLIDLLDLKYWPVVSSSETEEKK